MRLKIQTSRTATCRSRRWGVHWQQLHRHHRVSCLFSLVSLLLADCYLLLACYLILVT